MARCRFFWLLLLVGACGPRDGENSGGSSSPGVTSVSLSTSGSSTGTSAAENSSGSTTSGDHGGSGSTTLALDVGVESDGGTSQPAGCKGKIDFLFVISRDIFMGQKLEGYGTITERIAAAAPDFFATIATKFADFDYHILVTKGDPDWGSVHCDAECPGPFTEWCPTGEGYPCEMVGKASVCDLTWGAGVVFNAGWQAPNVPCGVVDGKRYLAKGQANLAETFACIVQVGASGYYLIGQALAAAVSPELTGPGGCNEGFLRDDALLVVTLVSNTIDVDSDGTPTSWAQAVIGAKGGDEESVVMFYIGPPSLEWCEAQTDNRLCLLLDHFPYKAAVSALAEDYGPAFDEAMELVDEACSSFIPG